MLFRSANDAGDLVGPTGTVGNMMERFFQGHAGEPEANFSGYAASMKRSRNRSSEGWAEAFASIHHTPGDSLHPYAKKVRGFINFVENARKNDRLYELSSCTKNGQDSLNDKITAEIFREFSEETGIDFGRELVKKNVIEI